MLVAEVQGRYHPDLLQAEEVHHQFRKIAWPYVVSNATLVWIILGALGNLYDRQYNNSTCIRQSRKRITNTLRGVAAKSQH